jgi:hypothetical protein
MTRSVLFSIAFTFVVVGGFSAQAQDPAGPARYTPPSGKPVISPYLDLYNRNTGPVPNYFLYVRPQLDQQRTNLAATQQIGQNLLLIDQNAAKTGQVEGQLKLRRQGLSATGSRAATFNNSLHFYPGSSQP